MKGNSRLGASNRSFSLSVLVPVYNERYLVRTALERLKLLAESELLSRVEVIVVDDGSTDGTAEVLARLGDELGAGASAGRISWLFLRHANNGGKGRAIRTALEHATGQLSVVQDADLEYHPSDLLRIIEVFAEEEADAVFGSRFAGGGTHRVLLFRHQIGNKLLTFLCNLVSNLNLTDVWTCYKAVRTDLLKSIPLVSDDFRIEPELTIKLAKREARIFEVPISYFGRTYREGKKIGWRDGLAALPAILRFGLSDDLYKADEYGSQILARLARAPRFNAWMADVIRPFLGVRVLEIGSAVGNLTRSLMPRSRYAVTDVNPLYIQTLNNLVADRPYLSAAYCDVTELSSFSATAEGYDTAVCLNVIEHVADDRAALENIKAVLAPGGRALILVPQGPGNFGTLDRALGHRRRYTRQSLERLAADCGLEIRALIEFNRLGTIAWFINGKWLRRRSFGLFQVWALNLLTPLMRAIDRALPIAPLSLIAVMERAGGESTPEVAASILPALALAPRSGRP